MGIGLTSHTSDGVRLSAQLGSRVARCMLDTTMTFLDRSVVLLSDPPHAQTESRKLNLIV